MKGRSGETGETGELLVLAELYRREVLGSQAARGVRGIDLLTSTGQNLQVKAKRGRGRWVLGRKRPAADLVVLVSVGKQRADDEFFVLPVGVLYDWAEDHHRAYWATRGDAVTGERDLVQIRDADADVREFLDPYRDAWEFITGARDAPDGRAGRAGPSG